MEEALQEPACVVRSLVLGIPGVHEASGVTTQVEARGEGNHECLYRPRTDARPALDRGPTKTKSTAPVRWKKAPVSSW
jgi:hypothetical protein